MGTAVAARTEVTSSVVKDLVEITKPRITSTVLLTAAAGVWLANRTFPELAISWVESVLAVVATGVLVSGASALNCWMERGTDAMMRRTRNRATAAGRLPPWAAFAWGMGLSAVALPVLTFLLDPLAGLLGFIALVSYVWVYTPMKRLSSDSLLVGAFPGAAPPLIGWTAVTGRLDLAGVVLFAVLFVWQLPHFLAIAYLCKDDYAAGGLKVHSVVRGEKSTKAWAFFWSIVQLVVSLLLVVMGVAGWLYGVAASVAGLAYIRETRRWLAPEAGVAQAKRVMLGSVLYLAVIFTALLVDVW